MISALLLTFIVTKQLNVMQDTEEIWKDVVGYEGLYKVSNLGFIKSFKKNHTKLVGFVGYKGYMYAGLHKDGHVRHAFIHRIVAKTFIENPFNKPEVNHKDGNKKNNSVSNLEWCTGVENCDHYRNVLLPLKTGGFY